ncbi:hypothetical protein Tco_0624943 [Tanacetum coccineum]|uniref:Uncharacterized protein n=1 Tax=Tanacetum coccineum TaxID=301880 RepID=A0ABQ4WFD0_9ASTR
MLMISSLPQERCINSYQSQRCLFGRELKISAVVSDIGKGTTPIQDFVVPTVDNTRSVSYTNVVPMEPTFVPGSANDVIKGLDLSENNKGPVSFAKLVPSEPSRKSMNFCTLVAPTGNEVDVAISLESVRAIIKTFLLYNFLVYSWNTVKQVYRPVSNKNGACTNSNKKQAEVARQEVSNSNPFDVLNSVENDDDLGMNGGIKGGWEGVLKCVTCDSEVEEEFNETADYMASTSLKRGSDNVYGTNSLLEQLRETKWDDAYDPYDDDLYESHDMSDNLQAICDDFDIKVHGRKKK